MPNDDAASTVRRTAPAPAMCPSSRGRPRAIAQRPLPSMLMATWNRSRPRCGDSGSCQRESRLCNDTAFHLDDVVIADAFDQLVARIDARVPGLFRDGDSDGLLASADAMLL